MLKKNKKTFFLGVIVGLCFSFLIAAAITFFVSDTALAQVSTGNFGATFGLGTADLLSTVIKVVQWALGFLGLAAVIVIMYGGFVWMTAGGNADKVAKAKKIIIRGVIGLLIILLAWAIVLFVIDQTRRLTGAGGCVEDPPCWLCVNGVRVYQNIPGICNLDNPPDTFRVRWTDPRAGETDVPMCSVVQVQFNGRLLAQPSINDNTSLYVTGGAAGGADCSAGGDGSCLSGACDDGTNQCVGDEVAGLWLLGGNDPSRDPHCHDYTQNSGETGIDCGGADCVDCNNINASMLVFYPAADYLSTTQYAIHLGNGLQEAPPNPRTFVPPASDPAFTTSNTTLDTPPTVEQINPGDGATDICLMTPIQSIFSSKMLVSSINRNTVTMVEVSSGNPWELSSPFAYPTPTSFSTRPNIMLTADNEYTLELTAGDPASTDPNNGVMDVCLNHLDGDEDTNSEGTAGGDDFLEDNPPSSNPTFPNEPWNFFADDDTTNSRCTPQLTGITPSGKYNDEEPPITLTGSNLGITGNTIFYNGVEDDNQCFNANDYPNQPCNAGWGPTSLDTRVPGGPVNYGNIIPSAGARSGPVAVRVDPGVCLGGDNDNDACSLPADCPGGTCETDSNSLNFTVASPQIWYLSGLDGSSHGGVGQYVSLIKRPGSASGFGAARGRVDFINMNTGQRLAAPYPPEPPCDNVWTDSRVIITVPDLVAEIGANICNVNPNVPNDWLRCLNTSNVAVQLFRAGDVESSNILRFVYTDEAAGPGLCDIQPECGTQQQTPATLEGENFGDPRPAGSDVNFTLNANTTAAPVTAWADQSITITTPDVDNSSTPYSVTVDNGPHWSNALPFDVPCGGIPAVVEDPFCALHCSGGDNDGDVCTDDADCPGGGVCIADTMASPNPYVSATDVCLNAIMGARFTTRMDNTTLNTTNIFLEECTDDTANCTTTSPVAGAVDTFPPPDNYQFTFTPGAPLTQDQFYRMTIRREVESESQVPMNQDYRWVFKTKNDPGPCPVERVTVTPGQATLVRIDPEPGSTQNYSATPIGPNCTLLDPTDYSPWSWQSTVPAVATVSGSVTYQETATARSRGTTYIQAEVESVTGRGRLVVNPDACAFNPARCQQDCPGSNSVCNVELDRCTPAVLSLSPTQGPEKTTVTINGCYFGPTADRVTFAGADANLPCPNGWTDRQIIAQNPLSALGNASVRVRAYGSDQLWPQPGDERTFQVTNLCHDDIENTDVVPPPQGPPGLCPPLVPPRGEEGTEVTFSGYGIDDTQTVVAQFSDDAGGVINTNCGELFPDDSACGKAPVPAGSQSGPARVAVNSCPSNSLFFGISCNNNDDCSTGCCAYSNLAGGYICQPAGLCSSGAPEEPCNLPANYNNNGSCQYGPTPDQLSASYRCIDAAGHLANEPPSSRPYDPPPAQDNCTVCCDPDQNNDGNRDDPMISTAGLRCTADKGACTGNERGLYCGCTSDNQCGDSAIIGCGGDTCCYGRPVASNGQPVGNDACRNAVISVDFSQPMDAASITNKNIFITSEPRWSQTFDPQPNPPNGPSATTALAVYNDTLYVGTNYVSAQHETYIYTTQNGTSGQRIDNTPEVGPVSDMVVYQNKLYVSGTRPVAVYDASDNLYDQEFALGWDIATNLSDPEDARAMAVFQNKLFIATDAGIIRNYTPDPANPTQLVEGGGAFDLGDDTIQFNALKVFGNQLYAGASSGQVYWTADGVTWESAGSPGGLVLSLEVYDNNLYAGNAGATVYVLRDNTWAVVIGLALLPEAEVLLKSYADRLYAFLESGGVYLYDGVSWLLDRPAGPQVRDAVEYQSYLYGGTVASGQLTRTVIVPARLSLSNSGGRGRASLQPLAALNPSTTYRVVVRGDGDNPNDNTVVGVFSNQHVGLVSGANYNYDDVSGNLDAYSWTFTTGNIICQIDHIRFTLQKIVGGLLFPYGPPDLFTCARDDCPDDVEAGAPSNQHRIIAEAVDKTGQQIPAGYTWSESDASDVIGLSDVLPNPVNGWQYITAHNQNGTADALATADGGPGVGTKTGRARVRVNVCEHPWPNPNDPTFDNFPFEDSEDFPKSDTVTGVNNFTTNFSTWYCRDPGGLPLLNASWDVIVREGLPGDPVKNELIKEYFFLSPDLPGDALGIRVMENQAGLSPEQWYRDQFGQAAPNPQSLTVNGYPAVRAGRTVYVAATNLVGNTLFHNIYLISYNEGASDNAVNIYNRLLNNWEFNINMGLDDKEKLQRDMRRLNDLNDIYDKLLAYKEKNGKFPTLEGGTYIGSMSVTKWPSWQETLGQAAGGNLPVDPLNNFVNPDPPSPQLCADGYAQDTCWNDTAKEYECPVNSHVYQYLAGANGDTANLFARLEYEGPGNWLQPPAQDPCTDISNARCNCFNYQFDLTGTAQDHQGPAFAGEVDTLIPGVCLLVSGTRLLDLDDTDLVDPSGVARVEYYIDGVRKFTDSDGTGANPVWSWSFDTTQYPDGNHTVMVRAYDTAGNYTDRSYCVTIDNTSCPGDGTLPFVTINTPEDHDTLQGIVPISGVASDNCDGVTLSLGVEDTGFGQSYNDSSNSVSATVNWNTQEVDGGGNLLYPNGEYTIRATATDAIDQTNSQTITITVSNPDASAPTVNIEEPADGANVTDTVTVSMTATDNNAVDRVLIYIDGTLRGNATYNTTNSRWEWPWDTTTYTAEAHTLIAFAYDAQNNFGSDTITVTVTHLPVDTTPPTISFVSPTPANGSSVDGVVTLRVEGLPDNSDVDEVTFYLDYNWQFIDTDYGDLWQWLLDTGSDTNRRVPNGWHTIQVDATDVSGNRSEPIEISVNVRGPGGPSITNASIYQPNPPSGPLGTVFRFQATVTDAEGVSSVTGSIQQPDETEIPPRITMNPVGGNVYRGSWTSDRQGTFYLDIIAYDLPGNMSEVENITGFVAPPICDGNGVCECAEGETQANCPSDCSNSCNNNGVCDWNVCPYYETPDSCSNDCSSPDYVCMYFIPAYIGGMCSPTCSPESEYCIEDWLDPSNVICPGDDVLCCRVGEWQGRCP